MPETLKVTTLGSLKVGDQVNLEPALKYGDELGGHLVLGHVDGVGKIIKKEKRGNSVVLTISHPRELGKYIAQKGSVAVEGVSLTVMTYDTRHMTYEKCPARPGSNHRSSVISHGSYFWVSLVPYTLRHTTLGKKKVGDCVNIEVDVLARYAVNHPSSSRGL